MLGDGLTAGLIETHSVWRFSGDYLSKAAEVELE